MARTTERSTDIARQAGMNPLDYLRQRGYVHDVTDEAGLREAFDTGAVTLYNGYDATAPSLHAGNLVSIMMLSSLQQFGHRPIALAGGGTTMIGDPSGKDEMRKMLTVEAINENLVGIKEQFARYIDFEGARFGTNEPAMLINNADWLLELRVIPFLRDIGRHFSVNEMLTAETYRQRLETTGLSFIEFNYRVLQSYDFLHLFRTENCILQTGGSDQWGNITAGVDLIRRADGGKAFGLVTPLITTSDGRKMGKSVSGAMWLDADMLSPFDYYQFWINTTDDDVARFMRLYTFLPEDYINDLTSVSGEALREAKAVLAWEATALTHGDAAADSAAERTRMLFTAASGTISTDEAAAIADDLPLAADATLADVVIGAGLGKSRNEVRRLAAQGGLSVNGERVENVDVPASDLDDVLVLRAGKKRFRTVRLVREG
ncbi:MAG: tyrosine--tRNA ligase [Thermomicrobiales bacterium]|nr:tyrosine--tRNA ligase [Thermomicrobiales bacterium]